MRRLGLIIFFGIFFTAVTAITYIQNLNQQDKIERIERKIVEYPCTRGGTVECRRFLSVLLASATKEQLHKLFVAKHINLSKEQLERLAREFGKEVVPRTPPGQSKKGNSNRLK